MKIIFLKFRYLFLAVFCIGYTLLIAGIACEVGFVRGCVKTSLQGSQLMLRYSQAIKSDKGKGTFVNLTYSGLRDDYIRGLSDYNHLICPKFALSFSEAKFHRDASGSGGVQGVKPIDFPDLNALNEEENLLPDVLKGATNGDGTKGDTPP